MNCSIFSDTVGVMLNGTADKEETQPSLKGSALQNPDISRLQLQAHLRRRARAISKRARKHFWASLLARQTAQPAND